MLGFDNILKSQLSYIYLGFEKKKLIFILKFWEIFLIDENSSNSANI